MNSVLDRKERITLEMLEDGQQHDEKPKGITEAQYAAACRSLKKKGMIYAAFVEGGSVEAAQIRPEGQAALDDLRDAEREERKRKVLEKIQKHTEDLIEMRRKAWASQNSGDTRLKTENDRLSAENDRLSRRVEELETELTLLRQEAAAREAETDETTRELDALNPQARVQIKTLTYLLEQAGISLTDPQVEARKVKTSVAKLFHYLGVGWESKTIRNYLVGNHLDGTTHASQLQEVNQLLAKIDPAWKVDL